MSIYLQNLQASLPKDNFVTKTVEKLNKVELEILRLLSYNRIVPYNFINEKLSIVLEEQASIIGKYINNLIEKNYIFLRDEEFLVVPNIYFNDESPLNFGYEEQQKQDEDYRSDALICINNIINYLITREIKFSKSHTLYKKDYDVIHEIFKSYSDFDKNDYNVAAYFFVKRFTHEEELSIKQLQDYFSQSPIEKILDLIKYAFPSIYNIINNFYKKGLSARLTLDDFKNLWINSLLMTNSNSQPFKLSFNNIIEFLLKTGLIELNGSDITVCYYDKGYSQEDELKLSSNYCIYLNSDSTGDDFYYPALFSEFIKYNKLVEYEITENSIRRAILQGLTINDITDYLGKYKINLQANVDTTIRQWFEKNGSYYYVSGTVFFCESVEKGKIISSLINKEMLSAFELKKNQVFLIQENQKSDFLGFLEKTGISFYEKSTKKRVVEGNDSYQEVDLEGVLKNVSLSTD